MNDFITNLLRLKDVQNLRMNIISTTPTEAVIELEHPIRIKLCPLCGCRMYSKGVYQRTVIHPSIEEDQRIVLKLNQRKWKCDNSLCGHFETDQFSFIGKNRRVTDHIDFRIVRAFKDYNLSAVQIAEKFKISDTYAISLFDRYVDLPRLKLTAAVCFDEVDLSMGKYKYALVIQDFFTGEPIDMVISRRKEITEPYFASIPKEERFKVKYVISDMYAPYQHYVDDYFPKAIPVVDAFHVIKLINSKLNTYLAGLRRKFKARDQKLLEERQALTQRKLVLKESKELYLLRKKKWLILSNQSNINYNAEPFRDWKFNNRLMYVSDYEQELFALDPDLESLRNLKEKYITFNNTYAGKVQEAGPALDDIIELYRNSGYRIFEEVAETLHEYRDAILNSFIMVERLNKKGKTFSARLSNGPMESLNRIPKDMKRHARGYTSFAHIRNRFLFASRKDAPILASPKTANEVRNITGKKRGPYRKHGGKKHEN